MAAQVSLDDAPTAIVLAGGRSSRMGQPKALLPFDGEPLIAHVIRRLQPSFCELIVVAAPDQQLPPLPVKLARDQIAYQGPVSGIYHGLEASSGAINFIGSCDIPFFSLALIEYLISEIAQHDVVVPEWNGRLQPLFAVYRSTVAPHLAEQLRRGELRPIFLFDKVRTKTVGAEEISRFDPEGLSFFNMNTPADYETARARWRQLHGSASARAPVIACTVELLGVARLRARVKDIRLELPSDADLAKVFAALAERLPELVGSVIAPDRERLVEGQACNINGREFVRDFRTKLNPGDRVFILSADAGG
jgi:molybdopterin-guanine dinucleotide biosynthesis protein A/molybdopterin converting factor small subunit